MSSKKNKDTLKKRDRTKLKNFDKPFSSKDYKIFDRYAEFKGNEENLKFCDKSLYSIVNLITELTDCYKIDSKNSEISNGMNILSLDNNCVDFLGLSLNYIKYVNSKTFKVCNCITSSLTIDKENKSSYQSINIERFLTIKDDYISIKDFEILKLVNKLNNEYPYKFIMYKDIKNKSIQIIAKSRELKSLEEQNKVLDYVKNFFEDTEVLLALVLKESCILKDKNKKM